MPERLIIVDGPYQGGEHPVAEILTIGRASENDCVLNAPTVSRRHARIVRRGGGLVLEDLASAHGTQVMGEKVKTRELRIGDRVGIGPFTLLLADDATPAATTIETADVLYVQHTASPGHTSVSMTPLRGRITDPETAAHRLETLLNIGLALQGERDIGRLLVRTAEAILQTLEADRCGIFLKDEADPAVVLTRNDSLERNLPFSRTLLGRAMNDGQALVTADAGRDRALTGVSLVAGTLRSALVSPLWGRERILGAVVVENHARAGVFDSADLRLLVALATLAGTAVENTRLIEEVRRETVERLTLSRFLSPHVADEIRRRGVTDGLRGEKRAITVLFTDIRQFTALSESLPPEELLEALNRGFGAMIEAVLAEDGTVDKLTGDGILAFFGAPLVQDDHAERAVRAARAIRGAVRDLVTVSGRPLPIGIGIATGEATVGPVGTDLRREYTAIGDVVNVAARLVGRAAGGQILATAAVLAATPDSASRSLGQAALKGKSEEIEVFEIL